MRTIDIDGEKFSVTFKVDDVGRIGTDGFENVVQVVCTIWRHPLTMTNDDVRMGVAHCGPEDEFDLYEGMELALERALATYPLEHLVKFWAALDNAIELDARQEALAELNDAAPQLTVDELCDLILACPFDSPCELCDVWKAQIDERLLDKFAALSQKEAA